MGAALRAESREANARQDKFVLKKFFGRDDRIHFYQLAIMAFPVKTESALADITGYDARTCRRWLRPNAEPPADALGIVLSEIMRRLSSRK